MSDFNKSGLLVASIRDIEEAVEEVFNQPWWKRLLKDEFGAITASGLYGPTLEKQLIDTLGQSYEAETHNVLMVTDTYTHNYDVHDFRDDITNEVTGTGYTAGGENLTATEVTFTGGLLTFDAADVQWTSSSISNAMAGVHYFDVGTAATDPLGFLSDFVTAASTTNGTFTIQWHANGIFTIDYTP